MRAAGIIVEYNPFHNGHLYHIEQTKKVTKADILIAVMSGSFVQRGEPAIVSKALRTRWALEAGCDLVIELPVRYVMQQADIFATEAVRILKDLHVSALCFGSENGNADDFIRAAEFASRPEFETRLQDNLQNKEHSYGRAYTDALASEISSLDVTKPNNILGFHYALANQKLGAELELFSLKRTSDYHAKEAEQSNIASATAIRKLLLNDDFFAVQKLVPSFVYQSLLDNPAELLSFESIYPYLRYRLLSDSGSALESINSVTEGIENRLIRAAYKDNADAFLKVATTKRYSSSRIRRTAMQILLQFKKEDIALPYHRLLGLNKRGQAYLSIVKKKLELPLVSTLSKADPKLIQYDVAASRLYRLFADAENDLDGEFASRPLLYF
ncbi:hypothetical protein MFLO_07747 [Listeria floridensis FSL S10-1187]|uniref:tRNA(Met) cytidine acetate ligase n=1 Tax=Listeria floridensis FSL S10-1187 TaxID=1265817 RepID=A0ABN0RFJ3_9LIST|nr:nucleotidyltransferase [Listeria floridensis]EUJ32061.1 hypothetical protein MFLO_07747 [Listeria floridensis FSL S10-1187]